MKANTNTSIFWMISFPRINTVLTVFFWSLSMLYLTNDTGVPKPEIDPFSLPVMWSEMGEQTLSNMADASITWTKSIASLPKFSFIQIEKHLEGCRKKDIGKKGYKFFIEGYIQDVYMGLNQGDQVVSMVGVIGVREKMKHRIP